MNRKKPKIKRWHKVVTRRGIGKKTSEVIRWKSIDGGQVTIMVDNCSNFPIRITVDTTMLEKKDA